jgi:dTMP kinase
LVFGGLQVSLDILKQLNANFLKPNLTIFIDTQPKICIERMKKARHHIELFEEEHKLEQIRKIYISLKNYFPNTHVIDGNRTPQEILDDVIKVAKNIV